ncbi:MAG: PIN domain-containing protein [Pseudomonadota bacterium]
MADVFHDTNIFLYAAMNMANPADEPKQDHARDLLANGPDFAVSGQTLQEFYVNATRKSDPPMTEDEIDGWVGTLATMEHVPVNAELVKDAIIFQRRYRIAYHDAAIVAAANLCGAHTLYTEDLNDGQTYGAVRAKNPFKRIPV